MKQIWLYSGMGRDVQLVLDRCKEYVFVGNTETRTFEKESTKQNYIVTDRRFLYPHMVDISKIHTVRL